MKANPIPALIPIAMGISKLVKNRTGNLPRAPRARVIDFNCD